ncbi:erythromycin esterase [Muriicola jejuensis]|uniref:Erythromycin esterase family protein n=1 Tax=Muriicola jejuensis TaxID=504488 RepID=A0A6P0UAW3_9FLAO|nr:erythromycin esterase family protein [Muriicola jejuensis]NER10441.1 hypothetical protein [Muriicola jejuensis]SMP00701.1 erythromycin esterase [Muriicola jejuensis]
MGKTVLLLLLFFSYQITNSQIDAGIFELNSLNKLLTEEVKKIINNNVSKNETVFLGEAVHYSGSDFLAKAEFVKYLVIEHGYKDIAFESDFFALLFDHDKQNLYRMWSKSSQCKELFDFLKKKEVTIWGFDNRIYSDYSYINFTKKLDQELRKGNSRLNEDYERLAKTLIRNQYNSRRLITKQEIKFLVDYTDQLLNDHLIYSNVLWVQILKSFKSAITLYTLNDIYSDKKRIALRDKQMAKNLDFLIQHNAHNKFIVWLANGHMSKSNDKIMREQTMGYHFRQLNPNSSYHIAVGSIHLAPRTKEKITKAEESDKSILFALPSVNKNYFIDSKKIIKNNPELNNKVFNDLSIFNLESSKTQILSHFDALVFIGCGEEVKYD